EWKKYGALGVLFVNISIGGTLTHFAAPPVLMVAATWGWDTPFMAATFGWKAAVAVVINATVVTALLAQHLADRPSEMEKAGGELPMPVSVALVLLLALAGVVIFAHHPVIF